MSEIPWSLGRAKPVSVRIGFGTPRPDGDERAPGLCVVGLWPGAGEAPPWAGDPRLEGAVVRRTRVAPGDFTGGEAPAVVQLRLTSIDQARALPGLDGPAPSMLRDVVRVALTAGAPELDLLLLSSRGLRGVDPSPALGALAPMLAELQGALLLFPDLPFGHGSIRGFGAAMAEGMRAAYQVALLDLPLTLSGDAEALIRPLVGVDVAVCAWEGSAEQQLASGWRSAAAFVAGAAGARPGPGRLSMLGQRAPLPPPRYVPRSRVHALRVGAPEQAGLHAGSGLPLVLVRLGEGSAQIVREESLRPPIGDWSLPALREVKEIHRRLIAAASRFVFNPVDDDQAIALTVALRRAVRDYTEAGVLVGPGGGAIDIRGLTLNNPAAPGLTAVLQAQLRPWAQRVNVAVSVRADTQPLLEVL